MNLKAELIFMTQNIVGVLHKWLEQVTKNKDKDKYLERKVVIVNILCDIGCGEWVD